MIVKNINFKILIMSVMFLFSSCNKWLDLQPQDGIVREEFWKTKEQLQSAVVGCYTSLLSNSLVQNLFIWGELRADMVSATPTTSANAIFFSNAEILSNNPLVNWSALYTTINYCNTVIEYAPEVIKNDKTITQEQLDAYISEARGIRALMYFYLLRIWGEVPLQLKASTSDSKIEQLAKSSKEEVYNQIVADLDFAAAHAAVTYGSQAMDKGRITRYTVYAIQADAYLWMDDYAKCIEACDKVINSNRFGLISGANPSEWYSTVYIAGNSNESIFEFQFDNQAFNQWYGLFADPLRSYEASAPFVTEELYGVDALNPLNKDIRGDGGSFRASDRVLWKHIGTNDVNTTVTASTSTRHWFVYRYADILLLKAEALTWSNKGQEALDIVGVIRSRAQALTDTEQFPDPTSAPDISDYILKERAREFAFEGKRWFDLLRNAKRNNYARINLITDMISAIAPPDKQQSMISKYRDTRSHYLPIIITELQADKLLIQNPFYN